MLDKIKSAIAWVKAHTNYLWAIALLTITALFEHEDAEVNKAKSQLAEEKQKSAVEENNAQVQQATQATANADAAYQQLKSEYKPGDGS